LADEPTAHLDRLTGRMIIRLLQRAVAESGATIVAASHDPDMIAAADERLILADPAQPRPAQREDNPTTAESPEGNL
jgi:ABC-type lipoprotein export system ATPase subunit